jgi:hypothetical protein
MQSVGYELCALCLDPLQKKLFLYGPPTIPLRFAYGTLRNIIPSTILYELNYFCSIFLLLLFLLNFLILPLSTVNYDHMN